MSRSHIPLIAAAGLVVLLSACVSEKAVQIPGSGKTGSEEMITEKVVEEVQLISKELSYYPDGVLAEYRLYTYADEGTLKLSEELFNSDDELLERLVYKYEDENYRSAHTYEGLGELLKTYDGNGELLNYHVYGYDGRGFLTEDALYDRNDELQTRQEYEYDGKGRKTGWMVYNGENALLSRTSYMYENGRNTRIENYSPDKSLLDYFVLEYDSEDRLAESTWYSGDERIEQIRRFIYEKGALTEEIILRGNGSVKRKRLFTNDSYGNPVEVAVLDGGDTVLELLAYEYVNRTRVSYREVKK